VDAQDKETLNYKGYALYKMARFDDAAKTLAAAVKIAPSYFVARLNAAKVACRRGQLAEARNAVLGAPVLAAQELAVISADGEFKSDCRALAADLRTKLGK
jgi:tetratricopeptide (TPR) repeat protein